MAYAATREGETGKLNDLCSSCSSRLMVDCHKNSDLRSKCPIGTV